MRLKPLLAAALTSAAVLTLAPAAHAGWITGRGSLPLMRSDWSCGDAMDFQYATYADSPQARLLSAAAPPAGTATLVLPPGERTPLIMRPAPAFTLSGFGVWVQLPDGSIDPDPVVAPADYAVPWNPLFVDPATIGGAVGNWPGGRPGVLSHSARWTLSFNRWLAPGTTVRVGWGNWSPDQPNDTSYAFSVGLCRSPVVKRP